jgi:sulfatase maturation enzyme AslB (radical SAM superfamily)
VPRIERLATLEIVLTTACNLACAYCYQNDKDRRRMEWSTLRQAVELLFRSGRRDLTLSFYGGEPLLEFPLMCRAVEFAESGLPPGKSLRFSISTNGMLLDDERAEFLARHRFDTQLSFDGVPAAQERRGAGTFQRLDATLDRLRARHSAFFAERLEVGMTLTGATLPCLADSIDYFLSKGIACVNVAPRLTLDPDWSNDRIAELEQQFSRVYRSCLRHLRRTGEVPLSLFRRSEGRRGRNDRVGQPICAAAGTDSLTLGVDGELRSCVLLHECYQKLPSAFLRGRVEPLRLGNLGGTGLSGRIAGYPAAARATGLFHHTAHKHSAYGRCADCRHDGDCFICPVSIGHIPDNTDPSRVPDFQCAFHRVALDYRSRFPAQPSTIDLLAGGVPVPELAEELRAFARTVPLGGT